MVNSSNMETRARTRRGDLYANDNSEPGTSQTSGSHAKKRKRGNSGKRLTAKQSDPNAASGSQTDDLPGETGDDDEENADEHKSHFKDRRWGKSCLEGFNNLYETKQLCDIKIKVGGEVFECHRAHLAASSQYFLTMFTAGLSEQDKDEITISMIEPSIMRLIIAYIYTGGCDLDMTNVQDVLFASDYFQLLDLKAGCEDYMVNHLDSSNVLCAYFLAQKLHCFYLENEAGMQLAYEIRKIMQTPEFLTLLPEQLAELFKYNDNYAREIELFQGALQWLEHDPENRKDHIYDVFSQIRFVLINSFFLFDKVMKSPLLMGDVQFKTMLDEVIQYGMMKERWQEFDFILKPRDHSMWERSIVYTKTSGKKKILDSLGLYPHQHRNPEMLRNMRINIVNANILGFEGNLYMAGGIDMDDEMPSSEFYKCMCSDKGKIVQLAYMNRSRDQFCFVQVDKELYAVGGCDSRPQNVEVIDDVECYNQEHDQWESVEPLPKPLRNACAVGFEGKLYVFGGDTGKCFATAPDDYQATKKRYYVSPSAFCYDPAKDDWTDLPDLTHARAWAGCAILNKKIYVIGGGHCDDNPANDNKNVITPLQSVEVYNPKLKSWEAGPDLPVPLYGAGVVKCNDSIVVLGGRFQNEISSSVFQLQRQSETWIQRDDLDWMNSSCIKPSYVPRCSYAMLDLPQSERAESRDHRSRSPIRYGSPFRPYGPLRQQRIRGSSPTNWNLRRWSRSQSPSSSSINSIEYAPQSPIHSPSPSLSLDQYPF